MTFDKASADIPKAQVQRVISLADAARTNTLDIQLGGSAVSAVNRVATSTDEVVGVIGAAVVLFVAFGSLLAMLLPIATALTALLVGLSGVSLLSHVLSISTISPTLGALIGLGVGIDYALFIVTRYCRGLQTGSTPEQAVIRAIDTSGRAVIFAGGTVCIALIGLLVLRVSFLSGIGIAGAIVVIVSVLASIILLPALLATMGMRVLSRRQRARIGVTVATVGQTGRWAKIAGGIQRRPVVYGVAALGVMLVLAVPALSLRLGSSDAGNDPKSSTTRQAYDLIAEGFGPGTNGPLEVVADRHSAGDAAALTTLTTALRKTPGVVQVIAAPLTGATGVSIIQVVPTTSPQAAATTDLVKSLRATVIPAAIRGSTLEVHIGGSTVTFADFASVIATKLPQFLIVVIGLGFLLLLLAFRSLVIPLTAAVINLLGAAATFGVIVAFFQWDWGSDRLGLGGAGPIESFLPVIILAILFGLSMDYQVFLVSRMHEEWSRTGDNHRAVRTGQAETGKVITAAAAIMSLVFVSFVFGGQRIIAEFGIGLTAAVVLDALLIRTLLVPSAMHLIGRRNWWLPGWLDRGLPHLSIDAGDDDTDRTLDSGNEPDPTPESEPGETQPGHDPARLPVALIAADQPRHRAARHRATLQPKDS